DYAFRSCLISARSEAEARQIGDAAFDCVGMMSLNLHRPHALAPARLARQDFSFRALDVHLDVVNRGSIGGNPLDELRNRNTAHRSTGGIGLNAECPLLSLGAVVANVVIVPPNSVVQNFAAVSVRLDVGARERCVSLVE